MIPRAGVTSSGEDDYNHLYKIVLVGDAGVGKTHLLNRYIKGYLPKNNVPTIGVEFATKTVTLGTGGRVKAQIWDTAGQERYRAITSAHYRRAVGALLVYDVTKEKTYENVVKWMEELKYNAEPNIVIMLVGNKVDLCDTNPALRKVKIEEAKKFAYQNKLLFEEASAITAHNVTDVFEKLLQGKLLISCYISLNYYLTEIYDSRNSENRRTQGGGMQLEPHQNNNTGGTGKPGCC